MGSFANLAHHLLSLTGLMLGTVGLLLVGALCFLSVAHLERQARLIVYDTLPSLTLAGEANVGGSASFNRTLMFLLTENEEQRAQLRKEVQTYTQATTSYLQAYGREPFGLGEKPLFDKVLKCRVDYMRLRGKVLELADQNLRSQAIELCTREMLPAYLRYKDALNQLFEFDVREGQKRGATIMRVCTVTQWVVAGIGVLVFIIGFLIGLFK